MALFVKLDKDLFSTAEIFERLNIIKQKLDILNLSGSRDNSSYSGVKKQKKIEILIDREGFLCRRYYSLKC